MTPLGIPTFPENALLLKGWIIESYAELNGELQFHALPSPPLLLGSEPKCESCSTNLAVRRHYKRSRVIRDIPMHGKPVIIHITEHWFRCKTCAKTFKPKRIDLADAFRMTTRCVAYIEVEAFRHPFVAIARDVGVDEKTIRKISQKYAERCEGELDAPWTTEYLGIDDIWLNNQARIVLVDLLTKRPIDLLNGHSMKHLSDFLYLRAKPDVVKIVCIDMASHFVSSITKSLPKAKIIFDKWHVQRQALEAVDKARLKCQSDIRADAGKDKRKNAVADITNKRLRKHRSLFLRRRFHDFGVGLLPILEGYLIEYPGISAAYNLKEKFCDIWGAKSEGDASTRMDNWLDALAVEATRFKAMTKEAKTAVKQGRKDVIFREIDPEILFRKVVRSITENRIYTLNYFSAEGRFTNAATEGMNGIIKQVQRLGRGYNFEQLRARILYKQPERSKNRKRVPNRGNRKLVVVQKDWFSTYELVPSGLILHHHGKEVLKCAFAGCRGQIEVSPVASRDENGDLNLLAVSRFCGACYDAHIAYFLNRKEKTARHLRQRDLLRDVELDPNEELIDKRGFFDHVAASIE